MPTDRTATNPDAKRLAIDLLVTTARFTRLAARETSMGMPTALWRALAQLSDLGPARVSDLAAADRSSQPSASLLVQGLVERGWAQRSTDPHDGRAVRIVVTQAGRAALDRARSSAAEALLPRLARLDAETLRALAEGVAAIDLVLGSDPPAPSSDQQG